ncbi:MAG: YicC family protein [Kordiimonadaceae bacterium]|nr:YicC family protein [Kordiimonadaceae bacterium]
MTMNSMTGFARGAGEAAGYRWNWEIKSVNNKGLDVRAKVPFFLDGFDLAVKKIVSNEIARGSVFVSLTLETEKDEQQFAVNTDRLQSLLDVVEKYECAIGVDPARMDGLLAIKGVVELTSADITDKERKALECALSDSLKAVLGELKSYRAGEGARMAAVLKGQLAEIVSLTGAARDMAGDRLESMHARFRQQLLKLEQVSKPVSEERLAQEIATMAVKADIQEELDRLDSHIEEAEKLMSAQKPVGRRLDFLCQEFNREANTLCSKSGDSALTKIGLDLKAVIDQFREQVQNIE